MKLIVAAWSAGRVITLQVKLFYSTMFSLQTLMFLRIMIVNHVAT